MRAWIIAVLLVGAALYGITFLSHDLMDPPPEPTQEEKDAALDEYLQMMEERDRLYKELIEIEKLRWMLENGKAWSA